MKKSLLLLLLTISASAFGADVSIPKVPANLVRLTALADYRYLSFARLEADGLRYDRYLQKIEMDHVVCTKRIDEISGSNLTVYEFWSAFPAVLHLTSVASPTGPSLLVTITPTQGCEYRLETRPAKA